MFILKKEKKKKVKLSEREKNIEELWRRKVVEQPWIPNWRLVASFRPLFQTRLRTSSQWWTKTRIMWGVVIKLYPCHYKRL